MNNSNWTLRFSRSAKDAYGHYIEFEDRSKADRVVFMVCLFALGFVLGIVVGGMQ